VAAKAEISNEATQMNISESNTPVRAFNRAYINGHFVTPNARWTSAVRTLLSVSR
jgi:hypothetical protein